MQSTRKSIQRILDTLTFDGDVALFQNLLLDCQTQLDRVAEVEKNLKGNTGLKAKCDAIQTLIYGFVTEVLDKTTTVEDAYRNLDTAILEVDELVTSYQKL